MSEQTPEGTQTIPVTDTSGGTTPDPVVTVTTNAPPPATPNPAVSAPANPSTAVSSPTASGGDWAKVQQELAALPERIVNAFREAVTPATPPPATPEQVQDKATSKHSGLAGWWFGN